MIRRHMVTIGGTRQVHYRRDGNGPPLVLLHQAPRSSADMIEMIERLAPRYTVIAIDTPGNGLSDPLPAALEAVSMADYADNLAAVLDALGIGRALIYGFHTGALCALAFSGRHPDRAALVVANGYIEMEAALRDDIVANYLLPFAPDWTGSHLAWWWARFRDQYIFFPFHRQSAATRTGFDVPDVAALHDAFLEFLRAGDGYRSSYRCAFAYDGPAGIAAARAPTLVIGDATDILYPYLDRIADRPANVAIGRAENPAAAAALLDEALARHATLAPPPAPPPATPIAGQLRSDFIQIAGGSLEAQRNDDAGGAPVLFLHDLGGSCRTMARAMAPWIGTRAVLAISLPGAGESSDFGAPATVEMQAAALADALATLGLDRLDVVADGAGATIALALAAGWPALVRRIAAPRGIIGAVPESEREAALAELAPAIVPDHYGSYLIFTWTMLRDRALFSPWHVRKAANAIPGERHIAPKDLHAQTVEYLKALPRRVETARSLLTWRPPDAIAVAVLVGAKASCPVSIDCRRVALPDDFDALAAALRSFFDDGSA